MIVVTGVRNVGHYRPGGPAVRFQPGTAVSALILPARF